MEQRMNPKEVEAAILSALMKADPKAEKEQRLPKLREQAKARAEMAEAEIASLMPMGLTRREAWVEVASLFLKP